MHVQNARQQNRPELNLLLATHFQGPEHCNRNAKDEQIAQQRHGRINTVHQAPLQTFKLFELGLELVWPVSRYRLAVENNE